MSINFLTFTYKIAREPSKNRVYVWRAIKDLGAVYLQQGVALLPYEENLYEILQNLRKQVNAFGGKSTLGQLSFLNSEDENDIILEFKEQINEEYNELQNNCQRLIYELDRETENEKFQFSELQESEEELKKLQRWYEKIRKRDYFNSESIDKAKEMLEKSKNRLQQYSDEVYKREEEK